MATTDCLGEETVLAFIDAKLSPEAASQVGSHLASCAECRVVVAELARVPGGPAGPLRPGSRLGRYQLIACIGAGGMGVVYSAHDPALGRTVAIKVLPEGWRDTGRFLAERQILASLEHPNICRLLDGGELESGRPFLVMELVEGLPIDRYCDERRLSVTARLALFRQVCAGAQHAHQHLVVHRDLKPGNILVTADGTPKLLDFGIAKLLQPELDARVTATGVTPMTPAFASPEQVRQEPITTASDVFSLGAVLYELLTSVGPWRLAGHSLGEVLVAIQQQEPEAPSLAVARAAEGSVLCRASSRAALRRALEGEVDAIVLMALRKEPRLRYQSAQQLSDDLRCHLEGLPTTARRGTTLYRTLKFVRRHKASVAAATAAVLALAVGAATTAWQARLAERRGEQVERRFDQVRKLAHAVLFDYPDQIAALAGSTPVRAQLVKDGLSYLDSLARDASDDRSLQRELAAAYLKIGDVQGDPFSASLGDSRSAVDSYTKGQRLAEALLDSEPGDLEATRLLASSHVKLGSLQQVNGELKPALAAYQRALALDETLARLQPGDLDTRYAVTLDHVAIGQTLMAMNEFDGALREHQQALTLREALASEFPGARTRRGFAAAHLILADVQVARGALDEALASYRRAQELYEAMVASEPTNVIWRTDLGALYQRLGELLVTRGAPEQAVELLRKLERINAEDAAADPENAHAARNLSGAWGSLGNALVAAKQEAEGVASLRKSLAILEKLSAQDPGNEQTQLDQHGIWFQLGEAELQRGELKSAEAAWRRAQQLAESILAASPAQTQARVGVAQLHARLGQLRARAGELPEAIEEQELALTQLEALLVDNPQNRTLAFEQARLCSELGRAHAALSVAAGRPAPARLASAELACASHRRAAAAWSTLKQQGELGAHAGESGLVDAELASCEQTLARLKPRTEARGSGSPP
jgi:non-specific serine/threonine protein kinase/serine/threonine-protein kinase